MCEIFLEFCQISLDFCKISLDFCEIFLDFCEFFTDYCEISIGFCEIFQNSCKLSSMFVKISWCFVTFVTIFHDFPESTQISRKFPQPFYIPRHTIHRIVWLISLWKVRNLNVLLKRERGNKDEWTNRVEDDCVLFSLQ